MKIKLTVLFVFLFTSYLLAQNETGKLYDPDANAVLQISHAVARADSSGKNVFLQIGGNWCPWCIRFNKFCKDDSVIDTLLNNNYVVAHINYSKENKNLDVLKSLGFPQRFGFPVIVILDSKGKEIHIQDSGLLEKDKSYDRNKVITFLTNWTPAAIDPKNYQK